MMIVMVRRSDSKDRMISAARRLFREHGYTGTAMSDVITESAAPRGSMYFLFPGGKEELAVEVALAHGAAIIAQVNRAAGTTETAAEFVAAFLDHFRDHIVSTDYREGCAVAPVVLDATPASGPLSDVTRRVFGDLITTMTARLEEKSVPHKRAEALAINTISAMEGAFILTRALRSPQPFQTAIAALSADADVAACAAQ
jgi:TetR/AcrR family transcriptional regulator, lmrAB and yxaGH operons repressor